MKTTNGKKGGNLVGKPHNDKSGKPVGGIKAVVTDAGGKPVELEGGEVIINKEASKKHWKELSKINQSAGNGVPISPPIDPHDEDPSEYKDGGKVIEFNRNHIPNKWILQYAKSIKKDHPEIWKLGGNIYGNTAFENLLRVSQRGYWLDSEEWMYVKWRSYVARHKRDFRIEGVVAMLKWVDKVDKGWAYMKNLIEEKIAKKNKMSKGGELIKRADGSYSKRGLWDNIRDNAGTGKKPTKQMLEQEAKIKVDSMRDGGSVKNNCIEFIKNTKSLRNNGYYLHIKNVNIYVGAGDKTIPKIKSLILITYNSGGQSNLKASDTINSSSLSKEVAKLIGGNLNVARIIVSEQMIHSKRISLSVLKGVENENIIIADRDRIMCTNLTANYEDGGSVGFENTLFTELSEHDAPSFKVGGKVKKANKGGDCYLAAGQLVLDSKFKKIDFNGTPYLVHAEVTGQGAISGIKYGHAWVEDDYLIYDYSNGRELVIPKQIYYAIGNIKTTNPKKYQKYTFAEAKRKMLSTNNYGCWDLDVEFANGGELAKGIRTEMEHKSTIDKFKRKGISDKAVAKSIAEDHIKEDSRYYTKLNKMESKMATGGDVQSFIDNPKLLVGKWVNVYIMGVTSPTSFKIEGVKVTDPKFRYRNVSITSQNGNIEVVPMEKLKQFVLGEQIELTNTKGEPYALELIKPVKTKMATGGQVVQKMGTGGSVTVTNGVEIFEGDTVILKGRTNRVVKVTAINPNWVVFTDLADNKRKDCTREAFVKNAEKTNVIPPMSSTQTTQTTQTKKTSSKSKSPSSYTIDPTPGLTIKNIDKNFEVFDTKQTVATILSYGYAFIFQKSTAWEFKNIGLKYTQDLEELLMLQEIDKDTSNVYTINYIYFGGDVLNSYRIDTSIGDEDFNPEKQNILEYAIKKFGKDSEEEKYLIENLKPVYEPPIPEPVKSVIEPPSSIPSTNKSVWKNDYNVGDKVRVRIDMVRKNNIYQTDDNIAEIFAIIPKDKYAVRPENPSGTMYQIKYLTSGQTETWEGKDLELYEKAVFGQKLTTIPTSTIPIPKPRVSKFNKNLDYVALFKTFLDTDSQNVETIDVNNETKNILSKYAEVAKDYDFISKEAYIALKNYNL